jgi:cytosine/adenosine deaminase-related metal-dependent hydrolase
MAPKLLIAKWMAPMDRPVLCDAGVVISDGEIIAVGSARVLRSDYPAAIVEDLGQVILLPGLVNAHVHLELSALTPGERPTSFVEWIKRLLPRNPPDADAVRAFVERGVAIGVRQCLQYGVTSVGDISRQCAITRPMLHSGPLRVVSYGEVQSMAQRRGFLEERLALAADRSHESDRLHTGISPHAPYSVEWDGYRRSLELARAGNLPLATHLAETTDEAEFLRDHSGAFRELWRYLDAWDEKVPTFAGGPIRFAAAVGLLDYPTLLAHVNYCTDEELALLAASRASVVYCPRTHAYFGHPPHRWREMLAAGVNVAIGTDSCASSPNLNLVDDLRLLHEIAPEVPVMTLWEMATIRAARAIQWEDRIGSITAGKKADFVTFAVTGNDPLNDLLKGRNLPLGAWIDGIEVRI